MRGSLAEVRSGFVVWCEEVRYRPRKKWGAGWGKCQVEGPGTCRAQMHVKAWSTEDPRPSRRWY